MPDILTLICSAIAREEGWWDPSGTKLPQRNNNPGDLRNAPWLSSPVIVNNYWVAPSVPIGIAGLYHEVALKIAEGYSLTKLVNVWAPAKDGNNPTVYLANVMRWTAVTDPDVPLCTLLTLVEPQ